MMKVNYDATCGTIMRNLGHRWSLSKTWKSVNNNNVENTLHVDPANTLQAAIFSDKYRWPTLHSVGLRNLMDK